MRQEGNSQNSSFRKVNLSQSFPENRAPFIIHTTRKMRNAFTTSDQKDKAGWDGRSEQQNDDQDKGKVFLYREIEDAGGTFAIIMRTKTNA